MPGPSCGTARRDLVEMTANPAARAVVETTRRVGRWLLLALHKGSNDRLVALRLLRDFAWSPSEH
jgi:hypothetical protein